MQKRYWLRGGIIAFVVGLLAVVLLPKICPYITFDLHGSDAGTPICNSIWPFTFIPILLVAIIAFSVGSFLNLPESSFSFLLGCTFIIIFTLLGMLIGWLYGKIKNRNKIIQ